MNDDLFEGLQIMSPEELNSAVSGKEEQADDATSLESEGFELTPVITERGDEETTASTKEVKPTSTVIDETKHSNENVSEVKYKALMKELVTAGILSVEDVEKLDELPGTFDTIKKLMEDTVDGKFKAKEDSWKQGLSPAKKRFLEIEDAFDDTDNAILMAQRLEFFDNISEDEVSADPKLQKQIYYDQLIAKNFSHEDALEAIEDADAVNKLEEKALKAIPELKKQANAVVEQSRITKEKLTKDQQEAQTQAFQKLLDNVDSRDTFIDGLQLNKIAKDKLKSNIMNPVHKDPKTGKEFNSLMYKQQRNPVEFEMLINYYDTLGLFNLDKEGKFKPDISKIKAVAKTQAVNELDKVIAAEEQRGVGRNTSVETSKRTEGILSMLESATKRK
jgi:hypothetical protein